MCERGQDEEMSGVLWEELEEENGQERLELYLFTARENTHASLFMYQHNRDPVQFKSTLSDRFLWIKLDYWPCSKVDLNRLFTKCAILDNVGNEMRNL